MQPRRTLAVFFSGLVAASFLVLAGFAGGVVPGPDFALSVDLLQDGRTLTYTVNFDNVGSASARKAVLTDRLPLGAEYLGNPGDVSEGVWSRTYDNVTTGAHNVTVAVRMPDSVQDGDRVLNVVELRFVDMMGQWTVKTYAQEFGLDLSAPPTAAPPSSFPLWVVVAPLAAAAMAAGGFAAYRPRRKPKLEQVFLMHNSGMLIHHWAANVSPTRDIDILSGMFVILKEFVRDSFREKAGGLTEFQFGDSRVFLAEGRHAILAAVASGSRMNGLPSQIASAVEDFERLSGSVLEGWNGHVDQLPGARSVVDGLVHGRYRNWRMT